MEAQRRKIIVLTPVRNEEWILKTFLEVTSQFADLILIADQASTDGSLSICRTFEKVHVISNSNPKYDEASRQRLLIDTARELVAEQSILLALDADEILAADSFCCDDWERMLNAKPGTVLVFEKPNIYRSTDRCLRYEVDFPGGYVDDGAEHTGTAVHSIRIPMPEQAPRLVLPGIKFLHYALLHPNVQSAKWRMYSVVENVAKTKNVFQRRRYYDARTNWETQATLENTDPEWFSGWEQRDIDVRNIRDRDYHWQDYETLKYIKRYGSVRFWLDDIWEFDWQRLANDESPKHRVLAPPRVVRLGLRLFFGTLFALAKLRRKLISGVATFRSKKNSSLPLEGSKTDSDFGKL